MIMSIDFLEAKTQNHVELLSIFFLHSLRGTSDDIVCISDIFWKSRGA